MAREKKHTAEQIVTCAGRLRLGWRAERRGRNRKGAEIVEQTYYQWRKGHGGAKVDQARRLKDDGVARWAMRVKRWQVGKDRVKRIWRREVLNVPKRQKPKGRLWLTDGSCVAAASCGRQPCLYL